LAHVRIGYSPADGERALALGLIDVLTPDLATAVAGADLVVLAAPVSVNAALMAQLAIHLEPQALVTDLSSVKGPVVRAAAAALGAALGRYVPSHPIAGAELSGPAAAAADLFDGRTVILSPLRGTDTRALARIEALWQALGARPQQLDVDSHDRLYAAISHWPHVVAFALAATTAQAIEDEQGGAERAAALVGPGLRDTTRIAKADAELWADILLANAGPVANCADAFAHQLERVRDALACADRERLVRVLEAAAHWRRSLE